MSHLASELIPFLTNPWRSLFVQSVVGSNRRYRLGVHLEDGREEIVDDLVLTLLAGLLDLGNLGLRLLVGLVLGLLVSLCVLIPPCVSSLSRDV